MNMATNNYFVNWQARQLIQRSSSFETLTYDGLAMNLNSYDKKTMMMILKRLYPKTVKRLQTLKNKGYQDTSNYENYKDLIGVDIESLSLNKMKELYIRLRRFNLNKGATPQGQKQIEKTRYISAQSTVQRLTGLKLNKEQISDLFKKINALKKDDPRITPKGGGEYDSDQLLQDVFNLYIDKGIIDYDELSMYIDERQRELQRGGRAFLGILDDDENNNGGFSSAVSMLLS